MGFISYIFVGLIAGFLAKLVMPGSRSEPAGFLGTMLLGIVGAIMGGWCWNVFLHREGAVGVDIGSIFVAFVGSCIVIALLRLFSKPGTTTY